MSENYVAIGSRSLYPGSRDKFMADRHVAEVSGDEIKKGADSTKKVESKAKKTSQAELRRKQKKEREERRQRLEKERKEAGESVERTREAAKKAVEGASPAQAPFEQPQKKVEPPIVPSKENPVIVESYPHLANSKREQVLEVLKTNNVKADIPENWDKMSGVLKERWLERHGIENVTQLPVVPKVFVDKDSGSTVYLEDNGRVFISAVDVKLDEGAINSLLERAGSSIKVSFPESFNPKNIKEINSLLAEQGVKLLPAVRGGAVKWPDNNVRTDPEELYRRLAELDVDEQTMGTAAFLASGENLDRQEILVRFTAPGIPGGIPAVEYTRADWSDSRLIHLDDAFIRLRALESMERILGTAGFNAAGLAEDRLALYEKIHESLGVEEVLRRLSELRVIGPLTLAQTDEFEALQKVLELEINFARSVAASTEKNGFVFVNNLAKAVETQEILSRANGEIAQLDAFLLPATRLEISNIRKDLDAYFRNMVKDLGPDAQARLFYDFENSVTTLESQLQIGHITSLKEFENRLYQEAIRGRQLHGKEGIMEWRAAQVIEGHQSRLDRERQLGVPNDWKDSMRNVNNNLRFIESGQFTQDEITSLRNRLVAIAENLSQRSTTLTDADDIKEADRMLKEVNEVKDSVLAFYLLKIAMEDSAMDPERILKEFEGPLWNDDTFMVYFKRFYKDHMGNEFVDNNGEYNMLDRGMQTIFTKLRKEKQDMNLIEGLSIVDIDTSFIAGDPRFDRIQALIGRNLNVTEVNRLEELRKEMFDRIYVFRTTTNPAASPLQAHEINSTWSNPYAAKDIVSQWYREKTILGAHGYKGDSNEVQYLRDRKDQLIEELKNMLTANGVSANLIAEYEESGLLEQVNNNAYNMAWVMGTFSDYDGIRIWNRDSAWFRDSKRGVVPKLGSFVYNTSTSMYTGRMVDHYGEFLTDEVRGRPRDVNAEFQKFMLGKKRGILGNNRMMVKFVADILDDARNMNKIYKDRLVVDGSGRSFRNILTEKQVSLEGVKKLDVGQRILRDGDYVIDGGELYDNGWARGAAIEELLEDCQISFENLEFSKLFENEKTNIIVYNMSDWWGDRNETKKYFASGAMQEYLKNPGTKFFFKMNKEIFYSKREIRIQPWMKLIIPAHQELGKHWQEWWKMPYDMPLAHTQKILKKAVRLNMVNYKYADEMETTYVGHWPWKNLRYFGETVDRNVREFIKNDWEYPLWWPLEFFKLGGQQMMAQFAGK